MSVKTTLLPSNELSVRGNQELKVHGGSINAVKRKRGGQHEPRETLQKALSRSVEIAAKRLSPRAFAILEAALDPEKTPELEYRWRLAAAKEILDRAFGRPKQAIEAKLEVGGSEEFLQAMKIAKERAKGPVTIIQQKD